MKRHFRKQKVEESESSEYDSEEEQETKRAAIRSPVSESQVVPENAQVRQDQIQHKAAAEQESENRETRDGGDSEEEASEESEESEEDASEESEESDSSDSSTSGPKLAFVSKKQRKGTQARDVDTSIKERALNYIEHSLSLKSETVEKEFLEEDLGGVDDTDDLDPELEQKQWQLRQLKRAQRDKQEMQEKFAEFEEQYERKQLAAELREDL